MKTVTIPKGEVWIEEEQRFIETDREYTLILEHSLVSIFRWEAEYKKPFLAVETKTKEETLFYIKCMTCNKQIPEKAYLVIPDYVITEIDEYINTEMTATNIPESKREGQGGGSFKKEIVTSEKVYCWMILYGIPVEFERWHFSRLMALIKLLRKEHERSDPNRKKRKRSNTDVMSSWSQINAQRMKRLGTRG